MDTVIELTDEAIVKAMERCSNEKNIRLGVTGGGCAGFEYVIEYADNINPDDNVVDYGKFKILVNHASTPFLQGSTLDYIKEGINEYFKIINPNEVSSCGCGVSVQF